MADGIDLSGQGFHFIGVGGIGMSALAYVLASRGLPVSGSDLRAGRITDRLTRVGVKLLYDQSGVALESVLQQQPRPLQVVYSSAIQADNPEYRVALAAACPLFHRSQLLAALLKAHQGIAVAGTHGKTTTSSLIAQVLLEAGLDPTIVVGGEVDAWGGNARVGAWGGFLVAEADESDGTLVNLPAALGVITNIELDHPDHYRDLSQVVETFRSFAAACGLTVACLDCPTVRQHLNPQITYSLDPQMGADYTVDQIHYGPQGTRARVWERGRGLGEINLSLLGPHNLSNALAAVAVGRKLGLEFATLREGIGEFRGAHRRFELRGEYHGIRFIDDYAHHPREVQVTLRSARIQVQAGVYRRVIAIFQPHRYSRTRVFLEDFARSFEDADLVVISDIYSAGEVNHSSLQGHQVAAACSRYHSAVYYQPSLQSVVAFLQETLLPGDITLFLGAGNLNQVIPQVMAFYEQTEMGYTLGRDPSGG